MLTTDQCHFTYCLFKKGHEKAYHVHESMAYSVLLRLCRLWFIVFHFLSITRACWLVTKCLKFKFNCFQMLITFLCRYGIDLPQAHSPLRFLTIFMTSIGLCLAMALHLSKTYSIVYPIKVLALGVLMPLIQVLIRRS